MIKGRLGLDHQGDEHTQTHHWQRLWQLTECNKYNKLYSATGFERTLQATLYMDSKKSVALAREDKSPLHGDCCSHGHDSHLRWTLSMVIIKFVSFVCWPGDWSSCKKVSSCNNSELAPCSILICTFMNDK